MRIVILACHELPAVALGCYGNIAVPTEHFDRLAAQGFVYDGYFSSQTGSLFRELPEALRSQSLWLHDSAVTAQTRSFAHHLRCDDWLADGAGLLEKALETLPLSGLIVLECDSSPLRREDISAAAEFWIDDEQALHEFQSGLAGIESTSRAAFACALAPLADWQRQQITQTARSLSLDTFLGSLLSVLSERLEDDDCLIVTSLSGIRDVTSSDAWVASAGEIATHRPLIILPPGAADAERRDELIADDDLHTLLQLLVSYGNDAFSKWHAKLVRQSVQLESESAVALRTREWLLVERRDTTADAEHSEPGPEVQLFHKPEDVWETLDVSSQFPDLVRRYLETGSVELLSEH